MTDFASHIVFFFCLIGNQNEQTAQMKTRSNKCKGKRHKNSMKQSKTHWNMTTFRLDNSEIGVRQNSALENEKRVKSDQKRWALIVS